MRLIRRIFVITCLSLITMLIWAGIYTRKQGFTGSWRKAIEAELQAQGYFVDIGKLTLGAFRGLVAEEVKIFRDEERTEQFASINDIYLDVGLERVLQKKIAINTLDIQDGKLTIPLNPENPDEGDTLEITKLSGRIALTENLIDIARVEANLAGVDFSIKGSLRRPQNQNGNQIETTGKRAFEATVSSLPALKKIIDTLNQFEFPDGVPTIKIDFRGDLQEWDKTTARVFANSKRFHKKGASYDVLSFDAEAEYDGRIKQIKIPQFRLQDRSGLFDADGVWNQSTDEIDFDLTSNADLVNLLDTIFPDGKLREVVFYQPPRVEAEGIINLNLAKEERSGLYFPGQIIGNFQTERFVSSGIIFNSSSGDFSVKEESFYVRNVRADHKTGVAFLNCKFEPGNGRNSLQFQSAVKMDPRVFAPFLKDEGTRRFLEKWDFSDDSGVHLAASGQSSSINLEDIQAKGVIDLRDFTLNQVKFTELETDFEIDGTERWYRNVNLTRDDGSIEAELAYTNTEKRTWEIKGGTSTVGLVEGFGAFSPMLKEILIPYRFSSPPSIEFRGIVDGRNAQERSGSPSLNDLEISFSGTGAVHYQCLGGDLPLDSPEGTLLLKQNHAHLKNFKAGLCGGTFEMEFETPDFLSTDVTFDTKIIASEIGLRSLGKIYGFENDALGHLAGEIQFSGNTSQVKSMNGSGQISVADRDLLQIPPFKNLGELLLNNEPDHSGSIKSTERSTASFKIKSGVFTSRDINLVPGTVNLKGNAVIDFPLKTLEAELSPPNNGTSRVYRCSGNIKSPLWEVIEGRRFTTLSRR